MFLATDAMGGSVTVTGSVKKGAKGKFNSMKIRTRSRRDKLKPPSGWGARQTGGNRGRDWIVDGGSCGPGGTIPVGVTSSGSAKARILGYDYKKRNGTVKWVGICADPVGYAAIHGGDQGYDYLGYWIPPDHWGYFYQMYNTLSDTVLRTVITIDTRTGLDPSTFATISNKTFEFNPVPEFDLGDLILPITYPGDTYTYEIQHYMDQEDAGDTPGVDTIWTYDPTTGEATMEFNPTAPSPGLGAGQTGEICAYTSQLGPGYADAEDSNVASTYTGGGSLSAAITTDNGFGCPLDHCLVCMAPTTGGPEMQGMGFGQLDWYSAVDGSLLLKDSSWGRVDFSYVPDTMTTWYLNICVARTDIPGPSVWVVQNLPLFSCTRDSTAIPLPTYREVAHFNLEELGLMPEQDITELLYGYSLTYLTLEDFYLLPADMMFAPIDTIERKANDSPDEPPEPPEPFFDPGAPEGVKGLGPATRKNNERDVGPVQEDDCKCCAGSFARSLDWLNRKYELGMDKTAQEIYDDLIDSGVSEPNLDGTTARDEWIERKDKYAKEQAGDRIFTKVWDGGDYVDTVPGVGEQSGDFLEWLKNEIETEDVEVAYYYPGSAHIVTIVGVYTKDGDVYVKYRDDETQGDSTTGDAAVKHAKVYEKDGKYHFGSDKNTLYFGVSESVTPPDMVIEKVGEDVFKLSWDEPGNYDIECSTTPDFAVIYDETSINACDNHILWTDDPPERELYFRLLRVIETP